MNRSTTSSLAGWAALTFAFAPLLPLCAGPGPAPRGSLELRLERLRVDPARTVLRGRDSAQSLVVTGIGSGTSEVDLTHEALFRSADPAIVGVPRPFHFENQIVPLLSKLGCAGGACHGKAEGHPVIAEREVELRLEPAE